MTKQTDSIDTPPHNDAAERTVLGVILSDPSRYAQVAGWLRPRHFYRERHRYIYRAIQRVADDGGNPTFLAVTSELSQSDCDVGDAYLKRLVDLEDVSVVPDMVNVERHAERLTDLYASRGLIAQYEESVHRLRDGEPPDDVAGDTEEQTGDLLDHGRGSAYTIKDYAKEHEELVNGEGQKYYSTEIPVIDETLGGGVALNRFYLLAALSGHGKSRLATAIAHQLISEHGFAVDWWYVDGHKRDVYDQFVARCGCLNSRYLDNPHCIDSEEQREELERRKWDALGAINAWENDGLLRIHAEGEPDVQRVKMETQRRSANLDRPLLVVCDYVQRFDAGFEGDRADYQNIRRTSRTLNDLKSLSNTVIFGLAQFNRSAGGGGVPKFRQMRGSSQLDDDANHALIFHRDAEEQAEDEESVGPVEKRMAVLDHAKSKHTVKPKNLLYADMGRLRFERWSERDAQRRVQQDRDDGWL